MVAMRLGGAAVSSTPCTPLRSERRGFGNGSRVGKQQRQPTRCQAPPSGAGAASFGSGSEDPSFYTAPEQPVTEHRPTTDGSATLGGSGEDGSLAAGSGAAGGGSAAFAAALNGGGNSVGGKDGGPLGKLVGHIRNACLAYDRAVKANPVVTKALTSFVGFAVGDRIAQSVSGGPYDSFRCARLSLYGLLLDGPVGHAWYKLLDRHVYPENPTCTRAVLIKTALDQLVWGPLMTLVFFSFLKTLEGHPELILSTIQERFWPTMLANYVLWPLAHLVNFRYVPTDYRILFNNIVAIGWTSWLSFTCGPASTVATSTAGHVAASISVDSAAAAAGALLTALPCSKVPGALSVPGVAEAVGQVNAMEHILSSWGMQVLPSSDVLVHYLHLKAEVMQSVCRQPIRMPPS